MQKTSIFIMPRSRKAWRGNEAVWVLTSGWASAGEEIWGEALVATTDDIFTPQEAILFPQSERKITTNSIKKSLRRYIPEVLITGYKDWRLKQSKPRIWPIERPGVLEDKQVMLVWERHDLFPGPGRRLATKIGVPFIISVDAPVVWEAAKWGVRRPIWGSYLESHVEAKSLKSADLVCCVSEEVRQKVIDLGVLAEKVIVSHNRVDSSIFNPGAGGSVIREKFHLSGKRVIGWTGSFRNFHGLDSILVAFKKVHERHSDTILMLIGDGLEFDKIKRLAQDLDISEFLIFAGKQPFKDIPGFVANFDVALVGANSAEGFHYSPLKLREYLALGKAVIAPQAGNLPILFKDGVDLLFYKPGDADDLARKINILLEDSLLNSKLKSRALELFKEEGTWVHELTKVCSLLKIEI